jgi:hypothetical protein
MARDGASGGVVRTVTVSLIFRAFMYPLYVINKLMLIYFINYHWLIIFPPLVNLDSFCSKIQ